jgi:hypothetical protein
MITELSHRRPRAHLVSFSPRYIAVLVAVAIGAAIGFGVIAQRVHATAAAPMVRAPGA